MLDVVMRTYAALKDLSTILVPYIFMLIRHSFKNKAQAIATIETSLKALILLVVFLKRATSLYS